MPRGRPLPVLAEQPDLLASRDIAAFFNDLSAEGPARNDALLNGRSVPAPRPASQPQDKRIFGSDLEHFSGGVTCSGTRSVVA